MSNSIRPSGEGVSIFSGDLDSLNFEVVALDEAERGFTEASRRNADGCTRFYEPSSHGTCQKTSFDPLFGKSLERVIVGPPLENGFSFCIHHVPAGCCRASTFLMIATSRSCCCPTMVRRT